MLYGKVLRAPSYGAKLTSVDVAPAKAMKGVTVAQDDSFVGVAAPTSFLAEDALDAIRENREMGNRLRSRRARNFSTTSSNTPKAACRPIRLPMNLPKAAKVVRQSYQVAYAQHSPLEPRAAVAEWKDGQLTVWTAHAKSLRRPQRTRARIPSRRRPGARHRAGFRRRVWRQAHRRNRRGSRAARASRGQTGFAALDARGGIHLGLFPSRRRSSKSKPASIQDGKLTSWHFININSGPCRAWRRPYHIGKNHSRYVELQTAAAPRLVSRPRRHRQ